MDTLLYDGACALCRRAIACVRAADLLGRLDAIDFRTADGFDARTLLRCEGRLQLIEAGGRLSEGFDALRRLSLRLPLLWWLAPLLWLPGARRFGPPAYDALARARFRLSAALGLLD